MRSRFHFDIWEAYDQVVIGLFLIGLIALLFSSCASKKVLVPEVHERIVHQRDTIYRVDSFLTSTTTIIRQADSTMMADYGIRVGKEKAWVGKQSEKGDPWYEKVLVFLGICDVAVALIWAYCKLSERARKIK